MRISDWSSNVCSSGLLGSLNDSLAPLLPAGFYYKTFMWPPGFWMKYEHFIRKAAGLGKAPRDPDPDRYEHCHAPCDVLVVGAGPDGLAAALAERASVESGKSGSVRVVPGGWRI